MNHQTKWQLLQLFAEEADPGAEPADAGQEPQAPRMTWEEILKDPEFNGNIQKIVRSRLKDQGQSRAALETLEPALKVLAKHHGLDPEHLDHAALARKITEPATPSYARQFHSHIRSLQQQEKALREIFPGFDLRQELKNPLFARLTSPGVGMGLEDAFYAVHRTQMQQQSMQVAAQKTSQLIANAIQSGMQRPREAGADLGPTLSRFDYRNATREQRQALKEEIRRAAAEGRKVYPG